MLLFEVEGKSLFKQFDIPIPVGKLAADPEEVFAAAQEIGREVVLKAQLSSGKRGKAGAIKFANTPEEAWTLASGMFGRVVNDEKVKTLLVEEKVSIIQEIYLGVTLDTIEQRPVIIGCTEGGMDIEEIAAKNPEKILKQHIDVLRPFKMYQAYDYMRLLGFAGPGMMAAGKLLYNLVRLYNHYNLVTVEINPLVVNGDDKIIAADSKVILDDSTSFKYPEFSWQRMDEGLKPLELEAKKAGFPFVLMENQGNIGIIGGGAGVGLATMDTIYHHGGVPVNFLDTGGGVTRERMAKALEVVLKSPGVKGVIANLFGGINNCAIMAQGIVDVLKRQKVSVPVVVKMRGHHQEEGWKLLEEHGVPLVKYGSTDEAAEVLMKLVREKEDLQCPC